MSPRRIAQALHAEKLTIWPRISTKLFVIVDLACFITQVAGAIMSGSEEPDEAQRGQTIILTGLVIQILAFGCFIIYVAVFHGRMKSEATVKMRPREVRWQRYLYGLYAVSVLFLVRNITRIVEYKQGHDGEILSKEVYLYILDSFVMLSITIIFLILHPGRVKRQIRRLDSAEMTLL